jgi:murein DD-endopeptidase MepM/ murein hydrolase activator NlpD
VDSAVFAKARRLLISALVVAGLLAAIAPISPVAAAALPRMVWPTYGHETQPFGCTGYKLEPRYGDCAHFHGGIDIANSRGTPIRAAADGTIQYVGLEPWYHGTDRAWVVVINHGNHVITIYVHLIHRDTAGVKKGAKVVQGQLIGLMGMTGRATGYHLHFGVKVNGVWTDPTKYLPTSYPPLH